MTQTIIDIVASAIGDAPMDSIAPDVAFNMGEAQSVRIENGIVYLYFSAKSTVDGTINKVRVRSGSWVTTVTIRDAPVIVGDGLDVRVRLALREVD